MGVGRALLWDIHCSVCWHSDARMKNSLDPRYCLGEERELFHPVLVSCFSLLLSIQQSSKRKQVSFEA